MKVLIIDRVKVFQRIIAGILSDTGIDHAFASTGKDGLTLLKQETYHCICISLHLDDDNGIELCKKIRKLSRYRHTPVVLLTTESSTKTMKAALNAGITDVFLKDNINELVNFIERFTQVTKPIDGRILYIEDQRSQRLYVTSMFKARNLEVDAYENAEDAWEAFLKNSYHLVLTDIVLEGEISGVLLINKIRRLDGLKGDTPILAITAFDDTSRRLSLYHMGITDYLTKPIMEEELMARVRNLINSQKSFEKEISFRNQLSSGEMVRRSQKMEAMGKLVGGIVHDYNNMLCIISGYTQVLTDDLADNPDALTNLNQISKASASATLLTRKLLRFTRRESGTQEVIDIRRLLNEIQPMLEKTLTPSIQLSMSVHEKLWNVYTDITDIENALLNMCINSKHAMSGSGKISILATNRVLGLGDYVQVSLPPGDYVQMSIQDTGKGMNKEVLSKIYDPFFTTKGEEGSGLGLSQVYSFMQRSQGAISVKSTPNEGTLFCLYFPRCEKRPNKTEADTVESGNTGRHKGGSVLIIDEENTLCQLKQMILTEEGYTAFTANNTAQALKILEREKIDLAVIDVIVAGENGCEFAARVKENSANTKIIMATSYDEAINSDERLNQYKYQLQKPITRDSLLHVVLQTLA
ncbi:response regulator [Pseudomonadota bacterium]